MTSRSWGRAGIFAILAAIQLVSYQNCGADFVVKDGLNLASSASICEENLSDAFKTSYQSFLKTNCASCHTSAGPGNGAFADSNSDVAFGAFLDVGYDRIDVNATNSAHAGGYTGSQNSSAINLAQQQWEAADAVCKTGGGASTLLVTRDQVMTATATAHDITWMLDTDLTQPQSTGGAKLIVAVIEKPSPNGTPVYYFSNPRLVSGSQNVRLQGLKARINGQEQVLGSTWSRVDGTSAGGTTPTTTVLSTAQMIIEYTTFAASDTLSFTIDSVSTP